MREKIKVFENKVFILNDKKHVVKSVKISQGKAMIFTDRQTFVQYEAELDEFITKIEFSDPLLPEASFIPKLPEVIKKQLPSEVMMMNSRADRISTKLEDMFNELSIDSSEENIKKATAMVGLSNAIVQVALVQIRCRQLIN